MNKFDTAVYRDGTKLEFESQEEMLEWLQKRKDRQAQSKARHSDDSGSIATDFEAGHGSEEAG